MELNTETIELTCSNDRITRILAHANSHTTEFQGQNYISTMPLNLLVTRINPPPPTEILEAVGRLSYRDFILVGLIVKREHVFPDNWIYVHAPRQDHRRMVSFRSPWREWDHPSPELHFNLQRVEPGDACPAAIPAPKEQIRTSIFCSKSIRHTLMMPVRFSKVRRLHRPGNDVGEVQRKTSRAAVSGAEYRDYRATCSNDRITRILAHANSHTTDKGRTTFQPMNLRAHQCASRTSSWWV